MDQFSHTHAFEWRTNASLILGYSQMLKEFGPTNQDQVDTLDKMQNLDWRRNPTVELLVLSACRTAVGDEDVKLGFAGLAVQAGAKSALASLWYVSDRWTSETSC